MFKRWDRLVEQMKKLSIGDKEGNRTAELDTINVASSADGEVNQGKVVQHMNETR